MRRRDLQLYHRAPPPGRHAPLLCSFKVSQGLGISRSRSLFTVLLPSVGVWLRAYGIKRINCGIEENHPHYAIGRLSARVVIGSIGSITGYGNVRFRFFHIKSHQGLGLGTHDTPSNSSGATVRRRYSCFPFKPLGQSLALITPRSATYNRPAQTLLSSQP